MNVIRWKSFLNKIYSNTEFTDKIFIECDFYGCNFVRCTFKDVYFIQCKFLQCSFEDNEGFFYTLETKFEHCHGDVGKIRSL